MQPSNAKSFIFVTLSGMVTFIISLQSANALYPILVTPCGISTSVLSPIYLYRIFPMIIKSSICFLSHKVLSKALLEIQSGLSGKAIFSRLSQPINASLLITLTLLGIEISVSFLQFPKAY